LLEEMDAIRRQDTLIDCDVAELRRMAEIE
jgi:hypothetical protein